MKIEWKEEAFPSRIILFHEGEEVRKISPRVVSVRDLAKISAPTWEAFLQALALLEEKGGRELALYSLSRRSYPTQKLHSLLKRHFLPEEIREKILNWCTEKGYLDDSAWKEQRVAFLKARGKSVQDIAFRLKKEGIDASNLEDDSDVLKKLISKKYPALLTQDLAPKERAKYIQALLRRGFSFQDIQKIISHVYPGEE